MKIYLIIDNAWNDVVAAYASRLDAEVALVNLPDYTTYKILPIELNK